MGKPNQAELDRLKREELAKGATPVAVDVKAHPAKAQESIPTPRIPLDSLPSPKASKAQETMLDEPSLEDEADELDRPPVKSKGPLAKR